MDLKGLLKPFSEKDIEWRVGRCGDTGGKVWATCLAYITARAVFERLDEVCGPENWSITYQHLNNGVVARLSIKCGTEWVTKEDGAEYTDIETFKGGMSGAVKRAASVWGIGRYLYDLPEGFAQIVERGNDARYAKTKEGKAFYWLPPELPAWALPQEETVKKPTPVQTGNYRDAVIGYGYFKGKRVRELTKEQLDVFVTETEKWKTGQKFKKEIYELIEAAYILGCDILDGKA